MRVQMNVTAVLAAAVLVASVAASEATTVLPQPLDALVAEAQRIFVGRCVAVSEGEVVHGGQALPYMEYRFEVHEVLKGDVGPEITIRHFGTRRPRPTADGRAVHVTRVAGMPHYEPGHDVLLLLIGDSSLGLTSPAGLGQGAFRITTEHGRRVAVNGRNNAGLFHQMRTVSPAGTLSADEASLVSTTRGPLDVAPLLSLIRKLARGVTP
jgi:hypothetical protein